MKKITLLLSLCITAVGFAQDPTTAAPTPPTRDAANVISIYSDAYTDITSQFGTDWDGATLTIEDIQVAGDNVRKITFGGFLGVDFTSNAINLTDFTHFHIDLYTETATLDKSFNHKLSNHASGNGETSAIEFSTFNGSTPALPNPNPGTWISYDIPLSSFTQAAASLDREAIAQYVLTSNLGLTYVDNIYFYKDGTASVEDELLASVSLFPNPAQNTLKISAKEAIQNAKVYNVIGKEVMSMTINKTSKDIDISNLNAGVYLIKYTINNAVGTSKFIKQ